jgi:hypothetical protein
MTNDAQWHDLNDHEWMDSAAYSAYKGQTVDLDTQDGFGEYSYDNFFDVMKSHPTLDGFWIDNDNQYWLDHNLYQQIYQQRPSYTISNNNEDTPIMDMISNEQKTGMTPSYDYPQAVYTAAPRLIEADYKLPSSGAWWYDGSNSSVDNKLTLGRMITNAGARPGDWLVLTKPLGTGIITTGIKRGITSPATARKAVAVMCRLNTVGAEVAERGLVRAGTDVTGFGLLGHLGSLCRASGVGAEIFPDKLPIIANEVLDLIAQDCIPGGSRENLKTANAFVQWNGATEMQKYLLTDAQTSGGLLLCVPSRKLAEVLKVLKEHHTPCIAVIGKIVRTAKARIRIIASPNRSP